MRYDTAKRVRVLGRPRFAIAMCMAMVIIGWISNSIKTWGAVSTSLQSPSAALIGSANLKYNSCLAALGSYPCYVQSMAWQDWATCMQVHLELMGWQQTDLHRPRTAFQDFIVRCRAHLPWTQHSNHTAVLLEFRALERQTRFSIDNIMSNLPIHWRVQIVGGPSMHALASRLYADEIAAQKVVVTSLALNNVAQVRPAVVHDCVGYARTKTKTFSCSCSHRRVG